MIVFFEMVFVLAGLVISLLQIYVNIPIQSFIL